MKCPRPGPLTPAATGTQAYVRKLEARLLSVRGAVELQEHCRELKGQLDLQVGGGVCGGGLTSRVPACPDRVCGGDGGPEVGWNERQHWAAVAAILPFIAPRLLPLPQAHALHDAEARASAAEEAARVAALDSACLKRGLELAAEQLTRSAGAEVPGTLLKAVARVRGLAAA